MYIRDHETIGDELTNIFSQIHVLPRLSVMRRGYAVVLLTLAESDDPKPITQRNSEINWLCGAANRIRTCDPVITNDVLYQLSYCGEPCGRFGSGAENACT